MNNPKPLISVIVPNYNHFKFLEERLASILNQTYQNFEIILLDDASTDDSLQVLTKYNNHSKVSHFIVNGTNSKSSFKQWKKGIDLANGDYIWIAESDDYSSQYFLEKMVQFLQDNSQVGIAYCQTVDVNEAGETLLHRIQYTQQFHNNIWRSSFVIEGNDFIKNYLSAFNVIPNACAVIFKKDLVDSNIFSESFLKMQMCGDWFFWIQIVKNTHIGFINDTLNYFRNHHGVTRRQSTLIKKKQRLLEEKEIRSFLQYSRVMNSNYEQLFYHRWFRLFKVNSLLKSSFYKAKLPKTAYIKFLYYYFNFKLKQRLK